MSVSILRKIYVVNVTVFNSTVVFYITTYYYQPNERDIVLRSWQGLMNKHLELPIELLDVIVWTDWYGKNDLEN